MKQFMTILIVLCLNLSVLSVMAGVKNGAEWLTDFEKAKKEATEKKRPILADFSGSDWCGWCTKLNKQVFSRPAFKEFARDNLILFSADFPSKKEQSAALKQQNKALSTTYAIRGFPTVLLLDATGKELARTGYRKGGAKAYVEHIQALMKK